MGCRPVGVSESTWKWEVGGGPIEVGRLSLSTCADTGDGEESVQRDGEGPAECRAIHTNSYTDTAIHSVGCTESVMPANTNRLSTQSAAGYTPKHGHVTAVL